MLTLFLISAFQTISAGAAIHELTTYICNSGDPRREFTFGPVGFKPKDEERVVKVSIFNQDLSEFAAQSGIVLKSITGEILKATPSSAIHYEDLENVAFKTDYLQPYKYEIKFEDSLNAMVTENEVKKYPVQCKRDDSGL